MAVSASDKPPALKRTWLPGHRRLSGWLVAVTIVIGIVFLPIAALFWIAIGPSEGIWRHLWMTVLPHSILTTIVLMLGVGALTASIGVGAAWLVVMCRFPGRRLFEVLLLIPLAFPTYIAAYCYTEFFGFTGPIQTTIRAAFDFQSSRDYWFPEIQSLPGAIFVMSVVLYPYAYLTTRAMFILQSACALDVSRTLGAGPWRLFFRVALPLARPAVMVGTTLAMMECLNDIGAVEFFGVRTMTFTVYDTWLNRGSLTGAAQIALVMLVFVVGLITVERFARRRARYHSTSSRYKTLPSYRLNAPMSLAAILGCLGPIFFGFLIPAWVLFGYAMKRLEQLATPEFYTLMMHSFLLAAIAAVVTVATGLIISYAVRLRPSAGMRTAARFASVGYAIPGTVLAVGILVPLTAFDNMVDSVMKTVFGFGTGLLLMGSGAALVFAYVVRFLAISIGATESGLGKITPHLDMAARTLGRSEGKTLIDVHLPMMRPILLSAALLVFVDCMKELPATILLRPFDFETLATNVYEAASRGAFEESALAAMMIVLVGLLPVTYLAHVSGSSFRDESPRRRGSFDEAVRPG